MMFKVLIYGLLLCGMQLHAMETKRQAHAVEAQQEVKFLADKEKQLFAAIHEREDLDEVKALIKAGVRVNAVDDKGDTPLLLALSVGAEDIALELLNAGANKDAEGPGGITPLMLAVTQKLTRVVQSLLPLDYYGSRDNEKRVNMQDKDGNTALMRAVKNKDWDMAVILLNAGADQRIRNNPIAAIPATADKPAKLGRPAQDVFAVAQQAGFTEFPELMERYKRGHAFMDALRYSNKKEAQALLEQGIEPRVQDSSVVGSPLGFALEKKSLEMVKEVIAQGADVNALTGSNRLLPLAFAKTSAGVKLLFEHGARVNERDADGRTALFYFVNNLDVKGNELVEVVDFLLKQGARLDVRNKSGRTILMRAAQSYDKEAAAIIKLLLESGQDTLINVQDGAGLTALMFAAIEKNSAVIRLLLAAGADASLKNKKGDTARSLVTGFDETSEEIDTMLKEAEKKSAGSMDLSEDF